MHYMKFSLYYPFYYFFPSNTFYIEPSQNCKIVSKNCDFYFRLFNIFSILLFKFFVASQAKVVLRFSKKSYLKSIWYSLMILLLVTKNVFFICFPSNLKDIWIVLLNEIAEPSTVFRVKWQDSHPKFKNPVEKYFEGRRLPQPNEFSVFSKFLLLWLDMKLPRFWKIRQFSCNAGQFFFVYLVISYWQLKVIIFRFYQELNAVWSKYSELSCGISHILLVFSEIIVYLRKMIVD